VVRQGREKFREGRKKIGTWGKMKCGIGRAKDCKNIPIMGRVILARRTQIVQEKHIEKQRKLMRRK